MPTTTPTGNAAGQHEGSQPEPPHSTVERFDNAAMGAPHMFFGRFRYFYNFTRVRLHRWGSLKSSGVIITVIRTLCNTIVRQ